MKRSEAIELLKIVIYESTSEGSKLNNDEANLILDKLDYHGFAPPEVTEPVETSIIVATPMGYVEQKSEDSKVFVRKWEDET